MDMSSFSACVLAGNVTFVCYVFRGNVVKCYEWNLQNVTKEKSMKSMGCVRKKV